MKEIIAKKSTIHKVVIILLFIVFAITLPLCISLVIHSEKGWIMLPVPLVIICFIPHSIKTNNRMPDIIIEWDGEYLFLYPNKTDCIKIKPSDITYIKEGHYHLYDFQYLHEQLTIETATDEHILNNVADIEDVRRKLENLKNNACF